MMVRCIYFIVTLCVCILCPVASRAQCIERGRFPNHLEECRGYTMCINGATGFMEYNLTCPETFVYSHIENLCTNVTSYKCLSQHNCTGAGNFEADSDENCTAYIACVEGIRGFLTARWVQCPQGTIFSSDEKSCVNNTLFECHRNIQPNTISVKIDSVQLSGNFSFNSGYMLNSKAVIMLSFILSFERINML